MKIRKTIGRALLAILTIALVLAGVVVMFLLFYPSVGKTPNKEDRALLSSRSNHYFDGKFRNIEEVHTLSGERSASSDRKTPQTMLKAQTPSLLAEMQDGDLRFTWLGHSSFLLQMGKHNVLVDPVLSERSSPVGFIGPKRFSEIPLTADELPKIDVLFISHDHYDHLDYRTILAIRGKVGAFVVPLGLDTVLKSWGIDETKIHTLDWWESAELGGLTCTLTPSQHFSGRNPLKGNSTLWGGLYLDDGANRVYYTGDGGYCGAFAAVRERLGAPTLMFAECGQYDDAWARIHMFPEQTVQAGLDAGAEWLVPVHWGAFCICNHAWDDSIRRVTAAAEASGLPLATPEIGQTVDCTEIARCTEPWWEAYE